MQYTTNYNLKKPDGTDNYNVGNDNDNMDIIDANMQKTITQATAAPTTPDTGDFWLDTSSAPNLLKRYDGAEWVMVGSVTSVASATNPGTVELPASAGSPTTPTVPYSGNSVQEVELTSTAQTGVLSFTPKAPGNFLVFVSLRVVTANTNVTVTITWTDVTGAQTDTRINNQSLSVGTHDVPVKFINATAAPITVQVIAGTASQVYASAAVEGV